MNNIEELKKGIYKHYKGNYYIVICVAKHTETLEKLVFYRALYDNEDFWIRPLNQFIDMVKYNNKYIPRFKFIMNVKNECQ